MTHTGTPIGCWHRARNSTARRHFTSASQVLTVAATKFLYFPTVSSAFDFAARASRAHAARGAGHVLRTPTSTISDDHSQTPLRAQLPRFFISLSLPRRAHRPCACPLAPAARGPVPTGASRRVRVRLQRTGRSQGTPRRLSDGELLLARRGPRPSGAPPREAAASRRAQKVRKSRRGRHARARARACPSSCAGTASGRVSDRWHRASVRGNVNYFCSCVRSSSSVPVERPLRFALPQWAPQTDACIPGVDVFCLKSRC